MLGASYLVHSDAKSAFKTFLKIFNHPPFSDHFLHIFYFLISSFTVNVTAPKVVCINLFRFKFNQAHLVFAIKSLVNSVDPDQTAS